MWPDGLQQCDPVALLVGLLRAPGPVVADLVIPAGWFGAREPDPAHPRSPVRCHVMVAELVGDTATVVMEATGAGFHAAVGELADGRLFARDGVAADAGAIVPAGGLYAVDPRPVPARGVPAGFQGWFSGWGGGWGKAWRRAAVTVARAAATRGRAVQGRAPTPAPSRMMPPARGPAAMPAL